MHISGGIFWESAFTPKTTAIDFKPAKLTEFYYGIWGASSSIKQQINFSKQWKYHSLSHRDSSTRHTHYCQIQIQKSQHIYQKQIFTVDKKHTMISSLTNVQKSLLPQLFSFSFYFYSAEVRDMKIWIQSKLTSMHSSKDIIVKTIQEN
jgi:hypothetical protein